MIMLTDVLSVDVLEVSKGVVFPIYAPEKIASVV
jgi:hypothetical protein